MLFPFSILSLLFTPPSSQPVVPSELRTALGLQSRFSTCHVVEVIDDRRLEMQTAGSLIYDHVVADDVEVISRTSPAPISGKASPSSYKTMLIDGKMYMRGVGDEGSICNVYDAGKFVVGFPIRTVGIRDTPTIASLLENKTTVFNVARRPSGIVCVTADFKNSVGQRRIEWLLDSDHGFAPVEIRSSTDGKEIRKLVITIRKYGNTWFPSEVKDYRATFGASPMFITTIKSAEFDRPEHKKKLDLSDLLEPGVEVRFRQEGGGSVSWKSQRWNGKEMCEPEKYFADVAAGRVGAIREVNELIANRKAAASQIGNDPFTLCVISRNHDYNFTEAQYAAATGIADGLRTEWTSQHHAPATMDDIDEIRDLINPRLIALTTTEQKSAYAKYVAEIERNNPGYAERAKKQRAIDKAERAARKLAAASQAITSRPTK